MKIRIKTLYLVILGLLLVSGFLSADTNVAGAEDGTLKWVFRAGGSSGSPAIGSDGTICVGFVQNDYPFDGTLYAINPDGTQKWAFQIGRWSFGSPAIGSDGTIYVGSYDSNLYAINPDGTQKWAFQAGSRVASSPAIGSDGTIYVGCNDDKVYAINPNGTQKWMFQGVNNMYQLDSSPAIGSDGTIYIGWGYNRMYALNPDGSEKWSFHAQADAGLFAYSSPALDLTGHIYIISYGGDLYVINQNGTQKWMFQTGSNNSASSPTIGSDGTIYVATSDGLYAINSTAGGLAHTPWPMFHHDTKHTGRATDDDTHTITATAGTGGTISPSGTITVTSGGSQTFTITANSGYQISDVKIDGTSHGAIGTYTFTNVTQDHTISATFVIPYEIEVPDIKTEVLGGLFPPFIDYYTFTLPSHADITISLFSTDFDTLLILKSHTGHKLAEDDNGHVDWGDHETDDDLGTNSEISGELIPGTYTIEVMSTSEFGIGDYTLVVRDIGNDAIETFCNKLGQDYPAVFPGPNYSKDTPNDWVAKKTLVGGDNCVGRCSVGCPSGTVHPCGLYRYTRDCFNHDVCVGQYSRFAEQCNRISDSCDDDCLLAFECAGTHYVSVVSCGGKAPCYFTIQAAIDAAVSGSTIKITQGSYGGTIILNASKSLILQGGWNSSFSTQTSNTTFIKAPKAPQGSLTLQMVTIKP